TTTRARTRPSLESAVCNRWDLRPAVPANSRSASQARGPYTLAVPTSMSKGPPSGAATSSCGAASGCRFGLVGDAAVALLHDGDGQCHELLGACRQRTFSDEVEWSLANLAHASGIASLSSPVGFLSPSMMLVYS